METRPRGWGYTSPAHMPEIAGRAAAILRGFDRERWTTCAIGHLDEGDVFALPQERPIRPVTLVEKKLTEVRDQYTTTTVASGEVRYIDTGEAVAIEMPANTSVLTRCDLVYLKPGEERPW
jgi:hypothetical protein